MNSLKQHLKSAACKKHVSCNICHTTSKGDITFHTIPTEEINNKKFLNQKWVEALLSAGLEVQDDTTVCSDHFYDEDFYYESLGNKEIRLLKKFSYPRILPFKTVKIRIYEESTINPEWESTGLECHFNEASTDSESHNNEPTIKDEMMESESDYQHFYDSDLDYINHHSLSSNSLIEIEVTPDPGIIDIKLEPSDHETTSEFDQRSDMEALKLESESEDEYSQENSQVLDKKSIIQNFSPKKSKKSIDLENCEIGIRRDAASLHRNRIGNTQLQDNSNKIITKKSSSEIYRPGSLVWAYSKNWFPAIVVSGSDIGMQETQSSAWVIWIKDFRITQLNRTHCIKPFGSHLESMVNKYCHKVRKGAGSQKKRGLTYLATIRLLKPHFKTGAIKSPYGQWLKSQLHPYKSALDEFYFDPYPTEYRKKLISIKERLRMGLEIDLKN